MLNKKKARIRKFSYNNKSFLTKLYDIINDINYKDIISWNIEGTGIIIKNKKTLCQLVLPKFYSHHNYSSFVRQLNLYGFHKIHGIKREGDGFEHDTFNKNITKDQIKQIIIKNKRKKLLNNYMMNNNKESTNINDILSINNGNIIFKSLLDKIENNYNNIEELKKEMIELNNMNKYLNEKIQLFQNNFNGHSILIQKILKLQRMNSKNNDNQKIKRSKNLKEFFKKYLYHLKIYSPYITIKNYNNIRNEINKKESTKKNNSNNIIDFYSNNNNIESFFEESSIYEPVFKIGNLDFNIYRDNSLHSFLYFTKDYK